MIKLKSRSQERRSSAKWQKGQVTMEQLESRQLLTTNVAPMVMFSDASVQVGNVGDTYSQLSRVDAEVSMQIEASHLPSGDAVTAWWAIFNNPQYCSGQCGVNDLGNVEVEAALVYADGQVVDGDGRASFSASLAEGDVTGVDPAHMGLPGAGTGLADATSSEIHLVLRTHGAAHADQMSLGEQLSTFNGGCNTECENLQASIQLPPDVMIEVLPVHVAGTDTDIADSSSRLTRAEDRISIRFDTAELTPGDAVTSWWVVFNNPEFCEGPCNAPDLSVPEVQAGLFNSSGAVIGEDGMLTIMSTLEEGDVSGLDEMNAGLPGAQVGLIDADKAEIHYVVRTHGAASEDPMTLEEQLTTLNGGCNPDCANLQASAHLPPGMTFDDQSVHLAGTDTDIADSSSRLTRAEDRISIRFDTAELTPGDAVTSWWVVFNNPEFCEGPCNAPDLSVPEVQAGLFNSSGAVIGEDGMLTIMSTLEEGDVSGLDEMNAGLPGAQVGLIDADKAEIHYVVRTHGAASEDPMTLEEQLTTLNGGCNPDCANVQASAHLPMGFGDFDRNGIIDAADVDLLLTASVAPEANPIFDSNTDGMIDDTDVAHLVEDVLGTKLGDANLDQAVTFADFLLLSSNFGNEGGWAQGDFDGDRLVGFPDFLILANSFAEPEVAEELTVAFTKTIDILAPGAVWVGSGELSDGTPIDVRLFDFVLAADGTTVEGAVFEITGEGREPVSLNMSGEFTPGQAPGTGAIALTGDQSSELNSTTENGVLTTSGTIMYADSATGEVVTAEWTKTIAAVNPSNIWRGAGELADGTPVKVRIFDVIIASDGTTIEGAVFEVEGADGQTATLEMSGEFIPGEMPGTGSISLTGTDGSKLSSTTENGLLTTTGEITFLNEDDLQFDEVGVSFTKTRQGESDVWSGAGLTAGGNPVNVTATINFDMLFEITGSGLNIALPLTGVEDCDRDVCFVGPQGAQLVASRLDAGQTFEGEISFDEADGERSTVSFSKTREGDTFVWAGSGRNEGRPVSVKATTQVDMLFEIMGSEIDAALALTGNDVCEDGMVCFVGPKDADLVASTPDEGQTFEGEVSFSVTPPVRDLSSEFGPEDEIGNANFLTPETVLNAVQLIKTGETYSLGQILRVDSPTNAFVSHEVVNDVVVSYPDGPAGANTLPSDNEFLALAETVDSNFMHVGTQFDGLGHIAHGDTFFNNFSFDEVFSPTGVRKLGVEEVPPIFTRGILIDVAAAKEVEVLEPGYEITASDIELALTRQGLMVELENGRQAWDINPGDAVLVNTGWGTLFDSDPETFVGPQPGLGVGAARALAANDVVLVGADNVFVDVFPDPAEGLVLPVHQEFETKNGIHLMQVVRTEELARDQVYEFAFSFAPIRVEGGTGSAAHPFALI